MDLFLLIYVIEVALFSFVFAEDKIGADQFPKAESLRSEFVVAVRGKVSLRDKETINPNMETGEIEIYAEELRILNKALTPPFYIQDGIDVDENVRLKYRYLDLRRPEMQKKYHASSSRYKINA